MNGRLGRWLRGWLRDNFIGKRSRRCGRICRSGLLFRGSLLGRYGHLCWRGFLAGDGCGRCGKRFGFIAFGQLGGGPESPG